MTSASAIQQAPPFRRVGRSILAIFAGFVVVVVLSLATDLGLHAAGITPPLGQPMSDPLLLLATVYRTAYGILGSYCTARLAPDRPMQHALIGGAIGLLIAITGAVTTWNHVPSLGPHWYPVALVITALPSAWLGGKIRTVQMTTSGGVGF